MKLLKIIFVIIVLLITMITSNRYKNKHKLKYKLKNKDRPKKHKTRLITPGLDYEDEAMSDRVRDENGKYIKEQEEPEKSYEEKEEALNTGAYHLNAINYPEKVTVYYIGDLIDNAYSKEFCGGPHVKNTSEIGQIEIYKQESVSDGVRRICLQIKK